MLVTLKCPKCSHEQKEEVIEENCVQVYKCEGCKEIIPATDCCIICDFSDKQCNYKDVLAA